VLEIFASGVHPPDHSEGSPLSATIGGFVPSELCDPSSSMARQTVSEQELAQTAHLIPGRASLKEVTKFSVWPKD
jgi:hypothetical protein